MKNSIENLPNVSKILTSLPEAIEESRRRRLNTDLVYSVSEFLQDDVPPHFISREPLLYLSRHLATPNFETLHAIQIARNNNVDLVIGEDPEDKFASNNFLKKSLGKISIVTGQAKNGDPIIENKTVVDFNTYSGLPFNKVVTNNNTLLTDLHSGLMQKYVDSDVVIVNESHWVKTHHNGDLLEYYKVFLSLMLVHGIMLEFYAVEDFEFVEEVLTPAFNFVENKFGFKPLICALLEPEQEFQKNWLAYPAEVKSHIHELSVINRSKL